MNRLRGSMDRKRAKEIADRLAAHKIASGKPFWSGYRDASRKLGLMIRTNGLPLALAITMDWAKLAEKEFPARTATSDDTAGRAWALIDLAALLWKDAPPADPAALREKVVSLTTLGRQDYTAMIEKALGTLLWQKSLSAPLAPLEKERKVPDAEAAEEAL